MLSKVIKMAAKRSKALIDRILKSITIDCLSLRKACEKEKITHGAFLLWCNQDKELANHYARARDIRADILAEEILEIADDKEHDTVIDDNGNEKPNTEWITRSKLRVDARKWLMAKMQPKKYGDKIEVDNQGEVGLTVKVINFAKKDDEDKNE